MIVVVRRWSTNLDVIYVIFNVLCNALMNRLKVFFRIRGSSNGADQPYIEWPLGPCGCLAAPIFILLLFSGVFLWPTSIGISGPAVYSFVGHRNGISLSMALERATGNIHLSLP